MEQIKQLADDLNKSIEKLQGQIQANGQVSEDTKKFADGLNSRIDEISKTSKDFQEEFKKELAKVAERVSLGQAQADAQESLRTQILKGLKDGEEHFADGKRTKSSSFSFATNHGQEEIRIKAGATVTIGNNLSGDLQRAYAQVKTFDPYRKIHVRSLLPQSPMTQPWFTYPKDLETGDNNVAIQTEGSAKGFSDADFIMVDVKPVTIAHYARLSLQSVRDLPWLSNYISTKMVEQLLNLEDSKLLTGTGGSNNIDGILNQATNYTKTNTAITSNIYEYLLDALAQLEGSNYSPSDILVHPQDFMSLLTLKSTTNEYTYPALAVTGGITLAGVPVRKATAISRLTGLVGDFSQTEMLTREGVTVSMSYEDSDNFTKNLVTVRVEEAVALAVYNAGAFKKMNFNQLYS
jgi:HK97 family phage major capsid protein